MIAGFYAPADSADARDQREAGEACRPVLPLPRGGQRRTRSDADPAAVLAALRERVDAHPCGERARAEARRAVWPYRSRRPLGTGVLIRVERQAVELLTDGEWVRAAAEEMP